MTPSMSIDWKRKNMEGLRTIMNQAMHLPQTTQQEYDFKTQKLASICKPFSVRQKQKARTRKQGDGANNADSRVIGKAQTFYKIINQTYHDTDIL